MKRIDLDMLSIMSGDEKRALENYVDCRLFRQRKSYDEYTIGNQYVYLEDLDVVDLMIIAENFKVTVYPNAISLEHKEL